MHTPVLLHEVLQYLDLHERDTAIDATANGGGHTAALLDAVGMNGRCISIEWDSDLAAALRKRFHTESVAGQLTIVQQNFARIADIIQTYDAQDAKGILFDLGFSSFHVDESERGFSFQRDELLDMRFQPNEGESATHLVNTLPEEELERLFRELGEEQFAGRIARNIREYRRKAPLERTGQLVAVVESSVPGWYRRRRINPATKVFQALRMTVNHELENIQQGITGALDVTTSGARIAIITFHSVEDRVVKNFLRDAHRDGIGKLITKKVVRPTREEVVANPRSRSAKLRIIEKI